MNKETKKANQPESNFQEPQPKGKADKGDKAVKKTEDKVYKEKSATAKSENPAKTKEQSEQPVHSVKSN